MYCTHDSYPESNQRIIAHMWTHDSVLILNDFIRTHVNTLISQKMIQIFILLYFIYFLKLKTSPIIRSALPINIAYTHIYVHTRTHMYAHMWTHRHVFTHTHVYTYTYTHTPIHTCVHTRIHIYVHTRTHTVCVYTHIWFKVELILMRKEEVSSCV